MVRMICSATMPNLFNSSIQSCLTIGFQSREPLVAPQFESLSVLPLLHNNDIKVLRADGRLVNMSGVFCTNNAQAPSLFSNVTLTSRRSYVEGGSLCIVCTKNSRHDDINTKNYWK